MAEKPTGITPKVLLHENPYSKLYHVSVDFNAFKKDYYVTYFGPRAGVVAVRDGSILLVKQYRFLPNNYILEIPGGTVDDNENLKEAIARECLEETGVACKNLKYLVEYYPGSDNIDNKTTIFYTDETEDKKNFVPDPREVIDYTWLPINECLERIRGGKFVDGFSIIGILSYSALIR